MVNTYYINRSRMNEWLIRIISTEVVEWLIRIISTEVE